MRERAEAVAQEQRGGDDREREEELLGVLRVHADEFDSVKFHRVSFANERPAGR